MTLLYNNNVIVVLKTFSYNYLIQFSNAVETLCIAVYYKKCASLCKCVREK